MSEENRSAKKICEFPVNSKDESEELRILADDPKYVCLVCSRAARNSENVCHPERMMSAWRP